MIFYWYITKIERFLPYCWVIVSIQYKASLFIYFSYYTRVCKICLLIPPCRMLAQHLNVIDRVRPPNKLQRKLESNLIKLGLEKCLNYLIINNPIGLIILPKSWINMISWLSSMTLPYQRWFRLKLIRNGVGKSKEIWKLQFLQILH